MSVTFNEPIADKTREQCDTLTRKITTSQNQHMYYLIFFTFKYEKAVLDKGCGCYYSFSLILSSSLL